MGDVAGKFEGTLRLVYLEYHLRDAALARKAMHDASFHVFTEFIRYLFWSYYFLWTEGVSHFISKGQLWT